MKELKIEHLEVLLIKERSDVIVKLGNEKILFANQNVDDIAGLILNNFQIVKNYYEGLAIKAKQVFNIKDIYDLSLSIVLHYLYLYNSWKVIYKKQENRSLVFNEDDFNNPSTHDIIFDYFKSRDMQSWKKKSSILLNMELMELEKYYKTREEFYNK